jgi:hypothetical protein
MTQKKLWAALCVVLEDHKRAGPNFQFSYRPDRYCIVVPEQFGKSNELTFVVRETMIVVRCNGREQVFQTMDMPRLTAREALDYCQQICWQGGGDSSARILARAEISACQIDTKTGILLDKEGHYWLGWGDPYQVFSSLKEARALSAKRLKETARASIKLFDEHGQSLES